VLESIDNVFGKIAREGRKFQIGLIAITQLPSIIEREILANMNTKIPTIKVIRTPNSFAFFN